MAQANGSFGLDPDGKPATSNGWNYFASLILGALQQMAGAIAGPSGTGVVGTYTTTHVANNSSSTAVLQNLKISGSGKYHRTARPAAHATGLPPNVEP